MHRSDTMKTVAWEVALATFVFAASAHSGGDDCKGSTEAKCVSCSTEFQEKKEAEWSKYGTLCETKFKSEDGQPVYALKDGDKLITYVAAKKGKSLDGFIGMVMTVYGPTMDLPKGKGQYVLASHVAVPGDIAEIKTRGFAVPIVISDKQKEETKTIRVFVSEDGGMTWKQTKQCKPSEKQIEFVAQRDGMYWFAIQIVKKDGTISPAAEADLVPETKFYVNTRRKELTIEAPDADLQKEVEQLRKTVERLEKRIKELESERKPN